ncbi:hypothetical protein NE235_13370 [Actinoallomurus spadix]|uniref:Uncharacterized protein n=1 Tax=Actinoallomurus spadix TaxID=79912 RepID=A0ABN0WCW8_9ACTN|nr:hypothetical protein [Actinoallomurus spadix]MCO5987091.1 hypothetical protein [Actinoallomurus spadix]
MTLLAATATATGDSAGSLLLFALVMGAGYIAACVIWPFRACRHCRGIGRFPSPTGRAWRPCHHCNGTGAKLRLGRRIYTHFKNTRDRGTR